MKKLFFVIVSLAATICLCACGKGGGGLFSKPTPTPIPEINPADLVTVEDVYAGVNYSFTPILEGGAPVRNGNTATATYRSEQLGAVDPVIVTVTQFNESVSKETVWNEYDNIRVRRPSAEMISGLGEDAFLAFPSIHVFDRGCHIQITAGSGANDIQRTTLINFANIAVQKLENIIPPSDEG